MRLRFSSGLTLVSLLWLMAHAKDASACGGCFHPPETMAMSTIVTAHRMAFATSGTRTVLWDQIKYEGNPSEFSWVLPIKGTVKLEASTDAWFEALDTVTNARVSAPVLNCFSRTGGDGCSCGGMSSAESFPGAAPRSTGGGGLNGGVIVAHEGSVGPYD